MLLRQSSNRYFDVCLFVPYGQEGQRPQILSNTLIDIVDLKVYAS